jgi:hypothetical protein
MSYPVKGKLRYPQSPSYKSLKVSELQDKADILLSDIATTATVTDHVERDWRGGKRRHVALQYTNSITRTATQAFLI